MTQVMKAELLEPVLPDHTCKVVGYINGCDQITEVVGTDIIIIIMTVFVLHELREIFVSLLFLFQKLSYIRNKRKCSVTRHCLELIMELSYSLAVLPHSISLFTNSDRFLVEVDSVPPQTDNLAAAKSVIGCDKHHDFHTISSESVEQQSKFCSL